MLASSPSKGRGEKKKVAAVTALGWGTRGIDFPLGSCQRPWNSKGARRVLWLLREFFFSFLFFLSSRVVSFDTYATYLILSKVRTYSCAAWRNAQDHVASNMTRCDTLWRRTNTRCHQGNTALIDLHAILKRNSIYHQRRKQFESFDRRRPS